MILNKNQASLAGICLEYQRIKIYTAIIAPLNDLLSFVVLLYAIRMKMKNNEKENKIQLRRQFAASRNALPPRVRAEKSRDLIRQLLNQDFYRDARVVFSFLPFRSEVDIRPIFEDGWKKGKVMLMPRIDPDRNEMEAVPITSFDNLKESRMKLLEPAENKVAYQGPIDLVITPGLAFDNQGYRLGYGGGYYDRFFSAHPFNVSVGVAFEVQRVPTLPHSQHDIPVHFLLTESGLYSFPMQKEEKHGT